MRRPLAVLAALALLGNACGREQEAERARGVIGRAMPEALSYPGSSIVSYSAGDDAAQIELTTAAPVQAVATWYRETLALNGWDVQSDAADASGALIIYAEKSKRPLWVTLRANVGAPGTTYTLMGAIVDSTKADSTKVQRSGSSMSSNRIQRR